MRHVQTAALILACLWGTRAQAQLRYTVDVRDGASHSATVTLRVDSLAARDSIFQFAATAPGTYQTMNIGRYVRGLPATDGRGREIPTRQISTNQWVFSAPGRVRQVAYHMADTWHTTVTEFPVYPMCGTDIDTDHALLNAHALLGFPLGMQGSPITMRVLRPAGWTVVTALNEGRDGFEAESYDHLIDSPVLMGPTLTTASLTVAGAPVRIAVYSPSRNATAPQLMEAMRGMLEAAGRFIGRLPVDRYVFLYRFTPQSPGAMGAWSTATARSTCFPTAPSPPSSPRRRPARRRTSSSTW